MLDTVVAWAAAHQHPLDWAAAAGPQRLTPMHLAAALPDGGRLAEAVLLRSPAPTALLWLTAEAAGGSTPAHLARLAGCGAANQLAAQRLRTLAAGASASQGRSLRDGQGQQHMSGAPAASQAAACSSSNSRLATASGRCTATATPRRSLAVPDWQRFSVVWPWRRCC